MNQAILAGVIRGMRRVFEKKIETSRAAADMTAMSDLSADPVQTIYMNTSRAASSSRARNLSISFRNPFINSKERNNIRIVIVGKLFFLSQSARNNSQCA